MTRNLTLAIDDDLLDRVLVLAEEGGRRMIGRTCAQFYILPRAS